MRVLVISNDLPPRVGGIQYYVDQLCRGMAASGDDVILYGSSYPGDSDWDADAPFRVVREQTSVLLPGPRTFRHSLRLIERYQPDVVVFGAAFPLALLGPRLKRRTGVPYVSFTHGLEVSVARAPGGSLLLRHIGSEASAITFVSRWCDEMLRDAFGSGPKFERLAPAVDPAVFHPGVDGSAIRQRHGLGEDPVIVCVSRVVERKGQDMLVESLAEIRSHVDGARLLIVGGGPYLDQIHSLAARMGVTDYVAVAGQVDDSELPSYFAAGDVFAMPCRERKGGLEVEAFGIVFIQAQAVGRPVIAGDIGGVPDSLSVGETGLLVDGTSREAVTAAVAALLGDPQRATRMGEAASKFVSDGFTWDTRTSELRALLAEVAGEDGR